MEPVSSPNNHSTPTERYFPVSPEKFVALFVLTWGEYQLYWFYKNWSYVRHRDSSRILPAARSLFAVLWYPALLFDIRKHVGANTPALGTIIGLSTLYLLQGFSWRLPDPFWLVSLLMFLPLLPAVLRINALNPAGSGPYTLNSRWKFRHLVLLLISGPILTLIVASSIGLVPSTQVIPGWLLWSHDRAYLEGVGVVTPGEDILYFYSEGLLSIEDDGNLLTDRRVSSYWRSAETEEFFVESATFSDIARIEPSYGNWIDSTVLKISRRDGSEFNLTLSAEENRDRIFIRTLREQLHR